MEMDISFAMDNYVRVAEGKRAAEALQLSEQHFRAYFDRAMVGMASTSPEKEWLEVNDALCEMLGYTREELMGMTWADLTHPDDLAANLIQFDRILSGEIRRIFDRKPFCPQGWDHRLCAPVAACGSQCRRKPGLRCRMDR